MTADESPEALRRRIAELQASLLQPMPDIVRQVVEQQIADLRGRLAAQAAPRDAEVAQPIDMSGGYVGQIIGKQTIQQFFGGQPGEDGERLLAAYLDTMAEDCQHLRLHRLTGKRQDGKQRSGAADALRLQDVYTSLTTDGPPVIVHERRRTAAWIRRLLERARIPERSPDHVAPDLVRMPLIGASPIFEAGEGFEARFARYADRAGAISEIVEGADPDAPLPLKLVRPELALEAIHTERRLVLLGEPGAGKSTALRYLALLLAQRLRGTTLRIPGWPEDDPPVPVVVPLGRVAAAIREGAGDAYHALLQVIGDVLEAGVRDGLRRFLNPALREGGLLLLCDGLDELPAGDQGSPTAPRVVVAAALRRLARETRARIVVTSRVLPYRAEGDWKLLPEDGWALRTVQPLAFGQTRAFVRGWYAALALTDPDLAGGKDAERAADLIGELEQIDRLRPLARSPLLLTMLAILHSNTGDVPRDRTKLYEECVELLLDRWEPERQPGMPRESLIQRLGLPGLEPLRRVLHELAYQAQLRPPGDDGRGLIGADELTRRMFAFFKQLGSLAEADARTTLFLSILDAEDGGLLQRRGDEGYAFPHLTFQEYLAACHLADQAKMLEAAYPLWVGADRERWRVALLLLMGRLSQQGKAEDKALPWLKLLAAAKLRAGPKKAAQRHQDTVLAALSFAELRERGAFMGSMLDIETEIAQPLQQAILSLLEQPEAGVPPRDRIDAARVLGHLGDPRFPVELAQWRDELARRDEQFGQPAGYLCYVPGGRYRIGGWAEGEAAAEIALQPLWVARFPITVAQYAPFVAEGYGLGAERWWTEEGWAWRKKDKRQAPLFWGRPGYDGDNQPVVTITWHEATAYCAWLTERLAGALTPGHVVRLPSEAEWEAAAAYDGAGQRRTYPWGEAEPTPELAIYDVAEVGRPAPVGCCPAGAADCGALDLAGNVWELAAGEYEAYPGGSHQGRKELTKGLVPWRGGSWYDNSSYVRCGARDGYDFRVDNFGLGFRCVVAPRLAQMS